MLTCIDFRVLNLNTILDQYCLLRVDYLLEYLHRSLVFSKIYLYYRYNYIKIHKEHEYKTAFQSHWGLYKYTRMLFGLVNIAETF